MGHGRYKNLWPMRQPGLTGNREIFKCTECNAETDPTAGHNGEPDRHQCRPDCRCNSKLTIVRTATFGENYDGIRFGGVDVPTGTPPGPEAAARRAYAENYDRVFNR